MFTCKDVCDNATDFLEGPTTLGQNLNLRLHLLICKNCRRFYRQFQIAVDVSSDLGEVEAPTDEEIDLLVAKLSEKAAEG